MWHDLKKEIAVEREALDRLLSMHHELTVKCASIPPTHIEISALSAMLHSFYTGIENLFKRVAVNLDQGIPRGEMWHSRLLDAMALPTPNRPAVITDDLRDCLYNYLNFRHVFRHAYAFELRWSKMAPLVHDCEATFQRVMRELDNFAMAMDKKSNASG